MRDDSGKGTVEKTKVGTVAEVQSTISKPYSILPLSDTLVSAHSCATNIHNTCISYCSKFIQRLSHFVSGRVSNFLLGKSALGTLPIRY